MKKMPKPDVDPSFIKLLEHVKNYVAESFPVVADHVLAAKTTEDARSLVLR